MVPEIQKFDNRRVLRHGSQKTAVWGPARLGESGRAWNDSAAPAVEVEEINARLRGRGSIRTLLDRVGNGMSVGHPIGPLAGQTSRKGLLGSTAFGRHEVDCGPIIIAPTLE